MASENGDSFGAESLEHITDEIISLTSIGIEVSIVIGGGNIFRGNLSTQWGIDRVEADNIGTLGTIINSLMLRGVLKSKIDKEVRRICLGEKVGTLISNEKTVLAEEI